MTASVILYVIAASVVTVLLVSLIFLLNYAFSHAVIFLFKS